MAGDWLKMDCSTPDKPEVLSITAKLGWDDADLTVGKLFRLWRWFDQQTVDGNAVGVSAALLDRIVGVSGFVEAVASVGWLTVTNDGVCLSKFDKHNGATAKSRAQTAKRVANHKSNAPTNGEGNGDSVSVALPREEKRREEESIDKPSDKAARTSPDQSEQAGDELDTQDRESGVPPCPHQRVLALWAEVLPQLPQHNANLWRGTRADHLRARWRETAAIKGWESVDDGIAYLRKLFAYVGKSEFLTGKAPAKPGGRPFVIELEWLINPNNWVKVHEGKYHEEEVSA